MWHFLNQNGMTVGGCNASVARSESAKLDQTPSAFLKSVSFLSQSLVFQVIVKCFYKHTWLHIITVYTLHIHCIYIALHCMLVNIANFVQLGL